jgi:hypothetical protein
MSSTTRASQRLLRTLLLAFWILCQSAVWADEPRSITFRNEAGYTARMVVLYYVDEILGGTKVMLPKTAVTSTLTLGQSETCVIPESSPGQAVSVQIQGVATTKDDFFRTVLPANFSGNHKYKCWGTIFNPTGGLDEE